MTAERNRSGGYVMFLVAAVIALLAIVLVTTARVQAGLSRPLRALREAATEEVAAQSIVARMAFLLLTEPVGGRSVVVGGARAPDTPSSSALSARVISATGARLQELRLDSRPYAVPSEDAAFASVQDEDGLLNLNAGDDAALGALIESIGVSRQNARGLAAALNDYVDEDDLVRPFGAEKGVYQRARLAAPTNKPVRAPWEAARAIGWRTALSERQRADIWALTNASTSEKVLNVNTAPFAVLEAVLGDTRMARTLIARREQSELRTLDDIQGITGAQRRADGVVLATRAGKAFRITVAFGRSLDATRYRTEGELKFADAGADRPIYWRNLRRARTPDGAWEGRDGGNGPERIPDSAALLAP